MDLSLAGETQVTVDKQQFFGRMNAEKIVSTCAQSNIVSCTAAVMLYMLYYQPLHSFQWLW